MSARLFTADYEAELRRHFALPYAPHYLIGALSEALRPDSYNGVERARGILAIFHEVEAELKAEASV